MTHRVLFIITFGIMLRLVFINAPMVDAFGSARQTYTAGYTRPMIEEGITISGLLNPASVVVCHPAVEIPIYNILTVFLARILGENDWVYRLTSLIFWSLGALYLAKLLRKVYGENESLHILWTYTLLPFSIFISRYYHPEILSVLVSIVVVFHYWFYIEKGRKLDLIISLSAMALALLVRASYFHLYFALLFMGFSRYGWNLFKRGDTYACLLPLIPEVLWSIRAQDLASGARFFQYFGSFSFRFTPVFWGMMLFNRLGGLILSPVGLPLLVLGVAAAKARIGRTIELAWLYAVLLYIFILSNGNFHHPHYQAAVLVPASLIIGRFLHQVTTGTLSGAWYKWWTSIPRPVIAISFSLYLFFNAIVTYLFLTQPWDIDVLKTLSGKLNMPLLLAIFVISQAVLIPVTLWIFKIESKGTIGPRPSFTAVLLILIFLTGVFVLHPMYRQDIDYLEAAREVRAYAETRNLDGKFIFAGKKDVADPFAFYSGMYGWAFDPGAFAQEDPVTQHNKGWEFIDRYTDKGAEYLAVMKGNRYLKPENPVYAQVINEFESLHVAYETSLVFIYDLTGIYRPAELGRMK